MLGDSAWDIPKHYVLREEGLGRLGCFKAKRSDGRAEGTAVLKTAKLLLGHGLRLLGLFGGSGSFRLIWFVRRLRW